MNEQQARISDRSIDHPAAVRWEPLEARILLSGVPGAIDLHGTDGDDHIIVMPGKRDGEVIVTGASNYADGTHLYGIRKIVILTGNGDDRVEVGDLRVQQVSPRYHTPLFVRYNTGAGNDTIVSSNSRDELHFEDASNVVATTEGMDVFQEPMGGVTVRLDLGLIVDDGLGGTDTVQGIDEVLGTSFDDVIYAGADSTGYFYGRGGRDLIDISNTPAFGMSGGGGRDTLIATAGSDQEIMYDDRDRLLFVRREVVTETIDDDAEEDALNDDETITTTEDPVDEADDLATIPLTSATPTLFVDGARTADHGPNELDDEGVAEDGELASL